MLKELFDAVVNGALKTAAPAITPFDPTKDVAYKDENNEFIFRPREPAKRAHTVATIEDMGQFARDHQSDETEDAQYKKPGSCFYDFTKVVYFPEDSQRFDQATLKLNLSPQLLALKKLNESLRLDQKQILWLLRVDLKDCLSEAAMVIKAISNVKINKDAEEEGQVQRGKSSYGTKIKREMTALESVPEYITFAVPVWASGVTYTAKITCVLDPDEEKGVFILCPIPGQIDKAMSEAEHALGERLAAAFEGSEVFLYNGTP